MSTILSVIAEIAKERQRQIIDKGYDAAHDDTHCNGELAQVAGIYALYNVALARGLEPGTPPGELWPWEPQDWKPKGARLDYIRAAALLVAEIERLDREEEYLINLAAASQ